MKDQELKLGELSKVVTVQPQSNPNDPGLVEKAKTISAFVETYKGLLDEQEKRQNVRFVNDQFLPQNNQLLQNGQLYYTQIEEAILGLNQQKEALELLTKTIDLTNSSAVES